MCELANRFFLNQINLSFKARMESHTIGVCCIIVNSLFPVCLVPLFIIRGLKMAKNTSNKDK